MATDDAGRLFALLDAQELALQSMEQTAAASASADLRKRLAAILAEALARAGAIETGGNFGPLLLCVQEQLLALSVSVAPGLLNAFGEALSTGADNATVQLDNATMPTRLTIDNSLRDVAEDAERTALQKLRDAAGRLAGINSVPQLIAGIARARQAVTTVERAAAFGVNRAVATGAERVAELNAADRLWIAERDACLHCTKYAGLVSPAGVPFPGGLTFDRKPLSTAPVPAPPLHPWCRCRVVMYRPLSERPGEVTLPEALQREARRSVARGFSLPTESEARRLEATDRLLRQGAGLPKTVEAAARRAVDRGGYPRGRNVP